MACPYCYARRMYKRFKWDETLREDIGVYQHLDRMNAGSKVFMGSTMELFGPWVTPLVRSNMFHVCELYPDLNFIFLTKQPQNLPRAFDDNCWVGVSVTDEVKFLEACSILQGINTKVKFISIEPLLKWHNTDIQHDIRCWMIDSHINWLIIGCETLNGRPVQEHLPKIEWIKEIVEAADQAGIPVFLKNNLDSLLGQDKNFKRWVGMDKEGNNLYGLRQEFPKELK